MGQQTLVSTLSLIMNGVAGCYIKNSTFKREFFKPLKKLLENYAGTEVNNLFDNSIS
jgi:hypothetical protein